MSGAYGSFYGSIESDPPELIAGPDILFFKISAFVNSLCYSIAVPSVAPFIVLELSGSAWHLAAAVSLHNIGHILGVPLLRAFYRSAASIVGVRFVFLVIITLGLFGSLTYSFATCLGSIEVALLGRFIQGFWLSGQREVEHCYIEDTTSSASRLRAAASGTGFYGMLGLLIGPILGACIGEFQGDFFQFALGADQASTSMVINTYNAPGLVCAAVCVLMVPLIICSSALSTSLLRQRRELDRRQQRVSYLDNKFNALPLSTELTQYHHGHLGSSNMGSSNIGSSNMGSVNTAHSTGSMAGGSTGFGRHQAGSRRVGGRSSSSEMFLQRPFDYDYANELGLSPELLRPISPHDHGPRKGGSGTEVFDLGASSMEGSGGAGWFLPWQQAGQRQGEEYASWEERDACEEKAEEREQEEKAEEREHDPRQPHETEWSRQQAQPSFVAQLLCFVLVCTQTHTLAVLETAVPPLAASQV
jgi:hypothetical protein